jgi:hypothetical protein
VKDARDATACRANEITVAKTDTTHGIEYQEASVRPAGTEV